jgi:hypothetical protein
MKINKLNLIEIEQFNLIGLFNLYKNYLMGLHAHLSPTTPEILESNTYLIGTADPFSTVVLVATDAEYRIQADVNGNWRIENPIAQGGSLTIYAVNLLGLRSEEFSIAVIPSPESVILPSVPVILEHDAELSGTADANVTIVVQAEGEEYRVKADADGFWTMANPIANGGSLMLYAENDSGLQSEQIGLAILMPEIPQMPEPPQVMVNSEVLSGTALANHKIIVTANAQEYVTYSDATGQWTMDNPIKHGGFASIVAENDQGVRSAEIQIAKLAFFEHETEVQITDILLLAEETSSNDEPKHSNEIDVNLDLSALLTAHAEAPLYEDTTMLASDPSISIPLHVSTSTTVLDDQLQPNHWIA